MEKTLGIGTVAQARGAVAVAADAPLGQHGLIANALRKAACGFVREQRATR